MLAGEPAGVIRSQEHGDGSDVGGLANPADRSLGDDLGREIRADDAAAVGALGLHKPGVERVDADSLRA